MAQVISEQEAAAILLEGIQQVSDGETVSIGNDGKKEARVHQAQRTQKKKERLFFIQEK